MAPRDPHEKGRTATSLELLFDLCFVVAIALAAAELHHGMLEAHFAASLLGFVMAFFAIWWAWMGFTWFASAYDNDDTGYRVKVLIQMVGVLMLAAGVPAAMHDQDFTLMTYGFVVMRIGLIALWIRAARADIKGRPAAIRYAVGLALCQVGWVSLLYLPLPENGHLWGWGLLVAAELAVPVWAWRAAKTTWHQHHISERYGLLTIIVIGESVLAATLALQAAVAAGDINFKLGTVIASAPLVMFSMWWLYFLLPAPDILTSMRRALNWGYGHLPIFMSAAAVGAALAVAADHSTDHGDLSDQTAGLALGIPVAIFLMSVWLVQILPHRPARFLSASFVLASAAAIGAAWTPWPTLAIGLLMTALVAISVVGRQTCEKTAAAESH